MGEALSALLRAAAVDIERLEHENAELCTRLNTAERDHAELIRRTYRKGYFAGRSASKRGAVCETAPERHARGEVRALLEGRARAVGQVNG